MRVLVVDDDEVTRKLLKEVLERQGYQVRLAQDGETAVAILKSESFPVVVSDIRMVELGGMDVLRAAKAADAQAAVILMTGFGSMEGAVEAVRAGAFDYISKPFQLDELKSLVARARSHWEKQRQQPQGRGFHPLDSAGARALVGKSPRMVEVYKAVARVASSSIPVLITGERGVGKRRVAEALFSNGPGRERDLVLVDGVTATGSGVERAAANPTVGGLLIDDLADLGSEAQLALLSVLDRETPRLVAVSSQPLEALVNAGKFRADLFDRLGVIRIEVPALRERMEDLPELVDHFLARQAERSRKTVSHVSEEAMACLKRHRWPGNLRELENAIGRAVTFSRTEVLYPEDFPEELWKTQSVLPEEPRANSAPQAGPALSLEELEKAHIIRVLQDVGFNKSKASEVLGIDRATLYRKASRYGIDLRGGRE